MFEISDSIEELRESLLDLERLRDHESQLSRDNELVLKGLHSLSDAALIRVDDQGEGMADEDKGRIWIEDSSDGGASFHILVPLPNAAADVVA